MADISCSLCGVPMDNPLVCGSGPLGYSAEGLIRVTQGGAGAVVTKTIMKEACINPTPHMRLNGTNGLVNSEGWSDYPASYWFEGGIQKAKEGGVKVLIANVSGRNTEELLELVQGAQHAGADIIEFGGSGYFESGDLVEVTKAVKAVAQVPAIVKINSNWGNAQEIGSLCMAAGADGITAMDSMGPVMRIDLASGSPTLRGYEGSGWLSGAPILPFTIQMVHQLAKSSKKDIIGLGGITTGQDALEMLLAGASCCGVCSAAIIHGPDYFSKLCMDLSKIMDLYGYKNIAQASRVSLSYQEGLNCDEKLFKFDEKKCTKCQRCTLVCPYEARTLKESKMLVDTKKCRRCGLCFDVCKAKAISRGDQVYVV